jgi:Holliday junction resolvase RusA-like endonuclease
MKTVYSLFVEGTPKAQPRPRKGKYGNFYNPLVADAWKEAIQIAFLKVRKPMIGGPVRLKVIFYFHHTGRKGESHVIKPDIDNLKKPVMDALTAIGVWKDDCQVFADQGEKWWTSGKSGADIMIETEE